MYLFAPPKSSVRRSINLHVNLYGSSFNIGVALISYKLFCDPLNCNLDIAHIHNNTPVAVAVGLRYARKRRKSLVVTWHGGWLDNYGGSSEG